MAAAQELTSLHAALPEQTAVQGPTTPKSPEALIQSCQGLVRSIAWKIHRKVVRRVELDDLIAYGQLGLAQAARDFDSRRGGQFVTYAYYRVRGAILDGLSQMAWFSRRDYHLGRYEHAAQDVLQTTATDDPGESATAEQNVAWLSRMTGVLSIAYLTAEMGAASKAMVDEEQDAPDAGLITSELKSRLESLIDALPEQPRALIRGSYYEGVTLQEVARRLGISKAWASRLHARALETLGRSLRQIGVTEA